MTRDEARKIAIETWEGREVSASHNDIIDRLADEIFRAWQAGFRQAALRAAEVCEQRARPEQKTLVARSEAAKCAAALLHELLCEPGEHVCYQCQGRGCDRCQGRGTAPYTNSFVR
jgi:hypothetical protein